MVSNWIAKMKSNWIEKIIKKSVEITPLSEEENLLVEEAVSIAMKYKDTDDFGLVVAAFYDLIISSVFISNATNDGWIYCTEGGPKLILPFINCCPVHALENKFTYHKASKPTSAKIGQATTRILLLFYKKIFDSFNLNIKVLRAVEPADAIFYEEEYQRVFFAEIKSSPLLALSIAMDCDEMLKQDVNGDRVKIEHLSTVNPKFAGSEIDVMIPKEVSDKKWIPIFYPIGIKNHPNDTSFPYLGVKKLLNNDDFIKDYLNYWKASYMAYSKKDDSNPIFWLTNACGRPSRQYEWDGGTVCISDEKTSVGMDRTDDIKKGIYQVLKLGSEGKVGTEKYEYKVGIISNIHPIRHFDSYLKPIKDMIWTIYDKDVSFARDLPQDQPLYNLFDGIVTFTRMYARDRWLSGSLKMFKKQ